MMPMFRVLANDDCLAITVVLAAFLYWRPQALPSRSGERFVRLGHPVRVFPLS
jgi:hypothetical protein